jgi:hypothetical protein
MDQNPDIVESQDLVRLKAVGQKSARKPGTHDDGDHWVLGGASASESIDRPCEVLVDPERLFKPTVSLTRHVDHGHDRSLFCWTKCSISDHDIAHLFCQN